MSKPRNIVICSDPPDHINSGAYQLIFRLDQVSVIHVGALGKRAFSSGVYIYTGRASRYLGKRLRRHLSKEKTLRWHIDYLLQYAHIFNIRIFPFAAGEECAINDETLTKSHCSIPVIGFGSSDCSCKSHLLQVEDETLLGV
jgi:Uri superfamily endonuclease